MKKNFIIAAILGGIALVCAALIAAVNMVTAPIIAANDAKLLDETCKTVFASYDADKSVDMTSSAKNDAITWKMLAKDSDSNELGYLYKVTGKNAYGIITLLVAVKNGKCYQVEFLENGQTFANVNTFVKNSFNSSPDNTVYAYTFGEVSSSDGHSEAKEYDSVALEAVDAKCGATYGANLVKDLVAIALADAKEVA